MLNSTIEKIALWASSSSMSLLAFCVSHLIIALLLLAGRSSASNISGRADGERALEVNGREPNRGGEAEDPVTAIDTVGHGSCGAPGVNGRPKDFLASVGYADAVEILASEKCGARGEDFVAADALQEKHDGDGEDELM
ncbi:hypothetical protein ABZP36_006687, partial [Zizania latifolia]